LPGISQNGRIARPAIFESVTRRAWAKQQAQWQIRTLEFRMFDRLREVHPFAPQGPAIFTLSAERHGFRHSHFLQAGSLALRQKQRF
jgi:hypothetical protein